MKIQIRNGAWETNSSSMHSLLIIKKRQTMTQKEIREEYYLDEDWNKDRSKILQLGWDRDEYGRGFNVLTSFRDKLSYALASMCGTCYSLKSYIRGGDTFYEVFEPLLKKLVGVDKVEMYWDSENFHVYSDSVTDDLEQDYTTYEEVPYEDLIRNENWNKEGHEDEDYYEEICRSGRKQEEIWLEVPKFGSIDHQSVGLFQRFLEKYNITLEEYLIRKDIIVIIDGDEYYIFGTMVESGIINTDEIEVQYPKNCPYDTELFMEKHPEMFDGNGKFDENGDWIDEDTDSE